MRVRMSRDVGLRPDAEDRDPFQMCFTAGASFTATAVLATAGTVTLREVRGRREWLLASFPMIFAVHQAIEGALWLVIGSGRLRPLAHGLASSYLIVAYCFWPIGSSAALYALEPEPAKRKQFVPFLLLGVGLSLYLLYFMILGHVEPSIVHRSNYYDVDIPHSDGATVLYAIAVLLPFFLSSYRPIIVLGVINVVFFSIAHSVYQATFHSVWCFFAAAISVNIYVFFRWLHRGQR